jgi:hypothetical protein
VPAADGSPRNCDAATPRHAAKSQDPTSKKEKVG